MQRAVLNLNGCEFADFAGIRQYRLSAVKIVTGILKGDLIYFYLRPYRKYQYYAESLKVTRKVICSLLNCMIVICFFLGVDSEAVTISNISGNASVVGRYEKFEVTFNLSDTYSNPFDINIVDVRVTFNKPDTSSAEVSAFFYKEYTEDSSGNFVNGRNPCWKARFSPSLLGTYQINKIKVIDHNGLTEVDPQIVFNCVESNKKGIIRTSSSDHYYLEYDNNEPYIPIGHNVAWLNLRGTGQWRSTFDKMGSAGENWVRIWMTDFYQGTSLEWTSSHWTGYYGGVGNLSMPIAWRLDRIIEGCEQNNIGIQLVLQHHGQFSTTTDKNWDNNPYNITHAGPPDYGFLSDPCQFFTDANAIRLTKNKYRYIVARWGYSPAILAWELFNEVQFTDAWKLSSDKTSVVNWHNQMASYIKNIDPFKHIITTSSHETGFENIWNLGDIDIVQKHYYGTDTIHSFEQTILGLADFNKPVVVGEFGLGGNAESNPGSLPEPQRTQVYEGLELHNGIWSSFFLKSSAHLWWWDTYIEPGDRYHDFTPLSVYAAGENLPELNLAAAQRAVAGATTVIANPEVWDWSAISTQKEFYLSGNCFPGMDKLNQYLQGSWQTDKKSDPNFHLNMATAGSLRIHVKKVSSAGTNSLQVLVNGATVFSQSYASGAANFIITVQLSAGQQSVQVVNTGQDWFQILSYEFKPETEAFLNSIGLSNDERAYIWIYDVNSQYGKIAHGIFHDEPLIVRGLDDGPYIVDVYATRGAGGVIQSGRADSVSGVLTYTLPDFSKDIAVKVQPLSDLSNQPAWNPNPPNDPAGNSPVYDVSVTLSWEAGTPDVNFFNIYFGEDANDVNNGTGGTFRGSQPFEQESCGPIPVEFNTTYYWRVDEFNDAGILICKGNLWTFKIADNALIDNFESYSNTDALAAVWSFTGSAAIALETGIVHNGGKSMKIGCSSGTGEVSRPIFSSGWAASAKALSFWYKGDANAAELYVKLESHNGGQTGTLESGYAVNEAGDSVDLKSTGWHQMNFDLKNFGIDLGNVTKLIIGIVPETQTSLQVYLDDIRLYPTRVLGQMSLDFNGDNCIDFRDYAIFAAHWLDTNMYP